MMRPKMQRSLTKAFAVLMLLTILTLFAAFGIHTIQTSNDQPSELTPAIEVVMN